MGVTSFSPLFFQMNMQIRNKKKNRAKVNKDTSLTLFLHGKFLNHNSKGSNQSTPLFFSLHKSVCEISEPHIRKKEDDHKNLQIKLLKNIH